MFFIFPLKYTLHGLVLNLQWLCQSSCLLVFFLLHTGVPSIMSKYITIISIFSDVLNPYLSWQKIDEKAIKEVFLKVLDNYIKWCRYLRIRLVYNRWAFRPAAI